jgi:hypothetical protein
VRVECARDFYVCYRGPRFSNKIDAARDHNSNWSDRYYQEEAHQARMAQHYVTETQPLYTWEDDGGTIRAQPPHHDELDPYPFIPF